MIVLMFMVYIIAFKMVKLIFKRFNQSHSY